MNIIVNLMKEKKNLNRGFMLFLLFSFPEFYSLEFSKVILSENKKSIELYLLYSVES